MLRSAQICKKCTILANLRTTTQERKNKIIQMTPFFSSTFWVLIACDIHFCIWKLPKFVFMGSSFRSFWSSKFLNFGGVSCKIRILSRSIRETYTLRKVKSQVLLFLSSWEPNLFDLMVYFCLFQNVILQRVETHEILSPFFSECSFHWLQHFFSTFGYMFELKFIS